MEEILSSQGTESGARAVAVAFHCGYAALGSCPHEEGPAGVSREKAAAEYRALRGMAPTGDMEQIVTG